MCSLPSYHEICMRVRAARVKTGMARCHRVRCRARFMECTCSKQSRERLPLVMEAKAKLTALKSQWMEWGQQMLMPPRKVMYCIHNVTPCTYHCGESAGFYEQDRLLALKQVLLYIVPLAVSANTTDLISTTTLRNVPVTHLVHYIL